MEELLRGVACLLLLLRLVHAALPLTVIFSRIFARSSRADIIGLCAHRMSTGVTPRRAAYSAAFAGTTARSSRQRMYVRGVRMAQKRRLSMRSSHGRSG